MKIRVPAFLKISALIAVGVMITVLVVAASPFAPQETAATSGLRVKAVNVSSDGAIHLQVATEEVGSYIVERSVNLTTWETISTNSSQTVPGEFMVQDAAASDVSFYRISKRESTVTNTFQPGSTKDGKSGGKTSGPLTAFDENSPPELSLIYPSANAVFDALASIPISTISLDHDGVVTRVDFYEGINYLGSDSVANPYSTYQWTNVPAGTYFLNAVALDNGGASATSGPVRIEVRTNIVAIADAHVRGGNQAANNFGTSTNVEVQKSTSANTRVGYFKFYVPNGMSNVSQVTFRFNAKVSAANSIQTTVYSTATNWIESGTGAITWNNAPVLRTNLGNVTVNTTAFSWYEVDVTSYVLGSLSAGTNVVSLALTNVATTSETIQINSKEAVASRPSLAFTVTNYMPSAAIVSPARGAYFTPPATIPITASATTPSGAITQVEIFGGTSSLGVVTTPPYSVVWNNVAGGTYNLTAKVTDNRGLISTSSIVPIYVDLPPSVSISAPSEGATFVTPTDVTLSATASDSDGSVSQVEFFAGSTSLGLDSTAPYSVVWNNVAQGSYVLTARATDNLGRTSTSGGVNITVFSPPTITVQPQSQITYIGASPTFSVTASGSGPTYQWRFNGVNIPGQTSSTLTLPNAQPSSVGEYSVVVSNPYGSVTSATATLNLTVIAAWGQNSNGQATLQPWMTNNIVSISAGEEFNAALKSDGTVVQWGASYVPAAPAGINDIVAIESGGAHVVALRANGTVISWGLNDAGQTNVPSGLTNIIAVSGGGRHSLALRSNGTIVGWGHGNDGMETNVPAGLNNIVAISGGVWNSMALRNDGAVFAWGDDCCAAEIVPAGMSAIAIASGSSYSMALRPWGEATIWGYDRNGQGEIPSGDYVAIAAGDRHGIGLRSNGTVAAWGGQQDWLFPDLNPPYAGQADVPPGLANVVQIGGGDAHTIALIANDRNLWPNVYVTSPANNSSFTAPTGLVINASASDWDGSVTQVDFYLNGDWVGTDNTSPYTVTVPSVAVGTYIVTAKATDNLGGTKTSAPISVSVSASLSPSADAHVKQASATSNFGTATTLEVRNTAGDHRVTYFKFDLSAIPVLTSAKLRFNAGLSGSGTVGTAVYSVADTNWTETGITWNNRPVVGSSLATASIPRTAAWYELDVTAYLKAERLAGRSIVSLALTNSATSTPFIQISSKEAATNRPVLLVSNTNLPPTVSLTGPATGTVYLSPANITITATASDSDGTISKVEFYQGATKLGEDATSPYSFTWMNVSGGAYTLKAVAIDNNGATRASAPVSVNVNLSPTVTLTSPANNAGYIEPAGVSLSATAADSDGTIAKMEFYSGPTKIAEASSSPFTAVWSNVPAGSYSITARAIDNLGTASDSSASAIVVYPLAETMNFNTRLGFWRFETTSWLGEEGQTPKSFVNVQNIALSSSNHVLQVDSVNPSNLKYRDVEANHKPNIDVRNGSVVFRFKPSWSSASAGGSGPGSFGQLISIGQWTSDASVGCWNLSVSANGNELLLITQTNGATTTNLVAPVALTAANWHQIAITYGSTDSAVFVNGVQAGSTGSGVVNYPNALVRATDGFSVGSNRSGTEQAKGQFDDLETFNYRLSGSQIAERPDTDSDGLPDGWEVLYGLNPYSSSGTDGPSGNPDGDILTNIEEWILGTDPTIGTLPGGGSGLIQLHTPLE